MGDTYFFAKKYVSPFGQDVLDGQMIVSVTLQVTQPGEFIELTFAQTMQTV